MKRSRVKGFWLLRLLGLLSLLRSGFPQNELKDTSSKVKGEGSKTEAERSRVKGESLKALTYGVYQAFYHCGDLVSLFV